MRSKGPNKKHVAYHEAGHAVIHLAIGKPFDYVTIIPGKDRSAGQVASVPGTKIRACDDAIICYAGSIADAKARHISAVYSLYAHGTTDRIYAEDCLKIWQKDAATENTMNDLYREYTMQARDYVNHCWKEIQKLADALLEKGILTYNEVVDLVGDSINEKYIFSGRG